MAVIQLEVQRPVCLELYQDCKDLGRFLLRFGGNTIAAGMVTKVGNCICVNQRWRKMLEVGGAGCRRQRHRGA